MVNTAYNSYIKYEKILCTISITTREEGLKQNLDAFQNLPCSCSSSLQLRTLLYQHMLANHSSTLNQFYPSPQQLGLLYPSKESLGFE